MSGQQNRLQKERNQKILLELVSLPGNNVCADCKARNPRWASHNLGIFICVTCASIHRKIGTHITKVKSLTVDEWTRDQIEHMKSMGNIKANAIYNPNELRNPPPPNLDETERDSEIEQYIRAKYEYRKFMDRNALVASKLGPSRSAASVTQRSASLPMTSQPQPSSSTRAPVTATDAAASSSAPPRVPPSSSSSAVPALPSSVSQPQTRSVSQPVTAQSAPPQQKKNPPSALGSVWDDINSLASPGQDSSLPLQYSATPSFAQATPVSAHINGALGANGYPVGVTSTGMGMNPFQANSVGQNPYSLQQQQSPFPATPLVGSVATPSMPALTGQPAFGQQYLSTASAPTTPLIPQSTSVPYLQAQSTLQVQGPAGQGFLSSSPSQSFLSAPTGQPQFISSSPSQQFLSPSPSQQFLSPSPSQQFLSHSPQSQFQMQQPQSATPQGQFMYQNASSVQPQMQLGMTTTGAPAQSQFLGMTTMQMQQQQMLMQQQQQQQQQLLQQQQQMLLQQQQQQFAQGMLANPQQSMFGGQAYPQGGGFQGQAGQWGAL